MKSLENVPPQMAAVAKGPRNQQPLSDAARRWQEESRGAIRAYNERIERDGPLNKEFLPF